MRQRADLHDDAAALHRRDAALERRKAAGDFIGDVELRLRERLRIALRMEDDIGADALRLLERAIEDVADRDLRRAGEPRRHHGYAADRPCAGDEHRFAHHLAAAIHCVQSHGEGLGEGEFAQAHVTCDRIALALAHHEVFAEHTLDVRKQARAAEKPHVDAELFASVAAVIAAAARV